MAKKPGTKAVKRIAAKPPAARKSAAQKSAAKKPVVAKFAAKKAPARPAFAAAAHAHPHEHPHDHPHTHPHDHAHDPQHDLHHSVEQFLYRQAEILDGRRWQDYIDLFMPDGIYWMPPDPADTTWDGVPSIFAEDRNLMTVRMKRVEHPDAWSQRPLWGTSHVVGNVVIERVDAKTGDLHVRSRFHMIELRRDSTRHFGGTYRHHLARTADGFRIRLQRVDLLSAQASFDYVIQVWV